MFNRSNVVFPRYRLLPVALTDSVACARRAVIFHVPDTGRRRPSFILRTRVVSQARRAGGRQESVEENTRKKEHNENRWCTGKM